MSGSGDGRSAGWLRVRRHLERAQAGLTRGGSPRFREALENGELELAADVLAELADDSGDVEVEFWTRLGLAYGDLGLGHRQRRCRLRAYESTHGFVEVRLTLVATAEGGRASSCTRVRQGSCGCIRCTGRRGVG